MRRSPVSVVLITLLVLLSACSSDDPDATSTTSSSVTSTAPGGGDTDGDATATDQSEDSASAETWEKVVAPANCMCSDGSEFSYYVRRADPDKVMFYLQGGGACFSKATCGEGGATYTRNLEGSDGPDSEGIFDFDNESNPFADYSMVVVPYCTGDVHVGNATFDYGDGVVIEHRGYVNASTALGAAAEAFPGATEVVVSGGSAGSAGSPLFGGLASDMFRDAAVKVLADGSGAYPDDPNLNVGIGALWGTTNAIPAWEVNEGMTAERWSLPGLFVQAGKHDPEIEFAMINDAYDATQASFASLVGIEGSDLVDLIDDNTAAIEAAGVEVASWVSPGDNHTILGKAGFYEVTVEGTSLSEWVARFIAGDDVADVHCVDCDKPG